MATRADSPRLFYEDLWRRPGERFTTWMDRLRKLEAFVIWPPIFDSDRPKPLAIGLGGELAELLDPELVGRATWVRWIRAYVRSFGYLVELQRPGSMRFDIDGHPLEEASEEHRQGARAMLEHLARRQKAKRPARLLRGVIRAQHHVGEADDDRL